MGFAEFVLFSEIADKQAANLAVWIDFFESLDPDLQRYFSNLPHDEAVGLCELALSEAPVTMASGRERPHMSVKKRVNFSDEDLEAAAEQSHRLWRVYAGIRRAWDAVGTNAKPGAVYDYMVSRNQPITVNDSDNKISALKRIAAVGDEVRRNRLTPFKPDFAANLERQLISQGLLNDPKKPNEKENQQKMMQRSVSRWRDDVTKFLGTHDDPNKLKDSDYDNFPSPYYVPDYHASEAKPDPKRIKFYNSPQGRDAYKQEVLDVACRATYGQIVSAMKSWWGVTPVPPTPKKGALCGLGKINDSRMAEFLKGVNFGDLVQKSANRILDFSGHPKYPYEGFRMQVAKWPVMRALYSKAKKANMMKGQTAVQNDWPGSQQQGGSLTGAQATQPAAYKGAYNFARTS